MTEGERFAMARRTTPPFRADHVGSLLRPPRLHKARADFAAGRITAADLRAVEDDEIIKAIRMQEEVGLQSATDGEFRRATWHMDFIYQLGGISQAPGHLAVQFTNPSGTIEWTPAALHVGSRVRLDHTIFGEAFTFVSDHVTMAVPKQKQSHARTAQRRAQHKLTAPTYNACPQCHSPRLPHRVCPVCGSYKGRTVVVPGGDEAE